MAMASTSVSIFGIRHHGPGSARSLLAALERLQPDLILVEGPPDAEALLPLAADPGMTPPVALLVYNPKNLRQASFFPFAVFSPEWQAIRFGLQWQAPLRFMDLPLGLSFALQPDEAQTLFAPEAAGAARADPFAEIARLAGYSDPERWWEATFERWRIGDRAPEAGSDVFALVAHLMHALREEKTRSGIPESPETLLREAHMRQTIRTAQKEGFQRIAVVCGAWHLPALEKTPQIPASTDDALFKGLKKVKTQATWIPWSFDRLATQSGYSAGVIAPAWYQVLWNAEYGMQHAAFPIAIAASSPAPERTVPHSAFRIPHSIWLARAARLLREHDMVLSAAHVLEAVRLAETLAALRNTLLPGIEELREAAVTVLCDGAEKTFELIEKQLIIGDVLGAVPDSAPVVPLKADFEAQLRSARLTLSTAGQTLTLDLREPAHLRKSQLLHRLQLLQIPWGKTETVEGRKEGGFHEHWTLQWLPDYEIRLIEAGAWGNTVEAAATRRAQHGIRSNGRLPELVELLGAVLKADLSAVLPPLLHQLSTVSALAQDVLALADSVLPLTEVLRYGHARRMSLSAIEQLLEQIIPRVCIQLPAACQDVNGEVAGDILKKILAVHRALGLLRREAFAGPWLQALSRIETAAAPLLAGLGVRLLFEQNARTAAQTATAMRYRLSHAQPPQEAAQWLEGFLQGSGLLLLHQPALWQILDTWVADIYEPDFPELLPLLRRTFSRFSGPEREKMLELAKSKMSAIARSEADIAGWDPERTRLVQPLLDRILGEPPTAVS